MRGKYFLSSAQARIACLIFCGFLGPAFVATAKAQTAPLVLLSEETSTRALALESVTFSREPFPLNSLISWGTDPRTRVIVFALNLQLQPGDDLSDITADAEDAFQRHHDLTVESAGPVPGQTWMSSLTLRLNDEMTDVFGDVLVSISYKGRVSNRVRIGIVHIGNGPADDAGSRPTSPYLLRGVITGDGAAFPGVVVTLQGDGSIVGDVTNSAGEYLIATVVGDYVLSASKTFYDFSPPTKVFNNLSQALDGVNFTASRQQRTIQGSARDDNGQPVPNVEMTLTSSGASPRTTTTDAAGVFSFANVPLGFGYTIAPGIHNIFTFTPQAIAQLTETTMLTFSGLRRTYTISGRVADQNGALAAAVVTLQETGATSTSDASGNYSFPGLKAGFNYTIAVSKSFYDFTPPTQVLNNLSQTLDSVNFTASRQQRTIQGIARDDNGKPVPSVEMTLTSSGASPRTTTTDAAGVFSFANVPLGFGYTIAPGIHNIFAFTPQTIAQLTETTMLTFNGLRRTYTISGRVADQNGALAAAVVTLQETGATSTSDTSGNYSFPGLKAGFNYTIAVSKSFYDFTPPTQVLNNLSQTLDSVNFTASRQQRTIQGIARDDNGKPVPSVEMTLTSSGASPRTTTTDAAGVFSFANVPLGFGYTIAPGIHNIFAFTPQTIAQLTETTMLTFNGLRRTYTISGRVKDQNGGVAAAVVTLQETGATTISDTSGNYFFAGLKAGFDYTITVEREDYVFEAPSVMLPFIDGNRQLDLPGTPHVFLRGRIVDQGGRGVFGIKVAWSGTQSGTTSTDVDGNYSFLVTAFGNYSLNPSKEQDYYLYAPQSINLSGLTDSRVANFNASLNASASPSYVLEFDGAPKTVDYSMPILTPVLDYNLFWPDGLDFGHFFWEFWAMPGENAGATYMISDGYGGAHAILFGVANLGSREPNRYQLIGNIWNGSFLTYFLSDEGPAPNEWGHFAAGWDGQAIVTYFNGVPVGKTVFTGPRMTPGGIQGCGRLLIGGSDHSNFIGRIAQVRGYETYNPREQADTVFASFSPETVFSVDGSLLSYFFKPAEKIADLSLRGQYGRQHPGLVRSTANGVLQSCSGCPLPQFVLDPTAPDFANPNNPGQPAAPVDAPAAVPANALVFDSFARPNSTYTLGGVGGLGSTEGGMAGTKVWLTNTGPAGRFPFGILNSRAVLLDNAAAIAWINAPSPDLDIQVDRRGNIRAGRNTGISFRVADVDNHFFAYSSDLPEPSESQFLTLGYYEEGVRTDLITGVIIPANWHSLRVVTTSAGNISVYADGTLLHSTTHAFLATTGGAGLYNNGPGLALTNRWDNFRIFGVP